MMAQFPDPVPLPENVPQQRRMRERQVMWSATFGMILRFFVIAVELYGVWLFKSSALLTDVLASVVDILFTVVLIISIKMAARPPDKDHPFGHGRYEPLAGMQLGLLMAFIGVGMLFQQGYMLMQVERGGMDSSAWMFALVPTIVFELCYQILNYTAKKQHSTALSAEAMHYRIDALTSLFATVALLLAAYQPTLGLVYDHGGAVLIAVVMVIVGFIAARENLHQLMDRVPDSNYFQLVRDAARSVEGVLDTEKVQIQLYGPDAHVDIDVEVDPTLPVEDAHVISQKVRAEIQSAWPSVRDVTVHIEPFYPGDH